MVIEMPVPNKYTKGWLPEEETLADYLLRMNQVYREIYAELFNVREQPFGFAAAIAAAGSEFAEKQAFLTYRTLGFAEDVCRWRAGDELKITREKIGANHSYQVSAIAMNRSERWSLELYKVSSTFDGNSRFFGVPWQLYRVCTSSPAPLETLMHCIKTGEESKVIYRSASEYRHSLRTD